MTIWYLTDIYFISNRPWICVGVCFTLQLFFVVMMSFSNPGESLSFIWPYFLQYVLMAVIQYLDLSSTLSSMIEMVLLSLAFYDRVSLSGLFQCFITTLYQYLIPFRLCFNFLKLQLYSR